MFHIFNPAGIALTAFFVLFLVSQILSILLGKGSEMLEFLTNYFLSKAVTNLQMWASESDVIKETGLNKY